MLAEFTSYFRRHNYPSEKKMTRFSVLRKMRGGGYQLYLFIYFVVVVVVVVVLFCFVLFCFVCLFFCLFLYLYFNTYTSFTLHRKDQGNTKNTKRTTTNYNTKH